MGGQDGDVWGNQVRQTIVKKVEMDRRWFKMAGYDDPEFTSSHKYNKYTVTYKTVYSEKNWRSSWIPASPKRIRGPYPDRDCPSGLR